LPLSNFEMKVAARLRPLLEVLLLFEEDWTPDYTALTVAGKLKKSVPRLALSCLSTELSALSPCTLNSSGTTVHFFGGFGVGLSFRDT